MGTGTMTAVCTKKEDGQLRAVDLPADVIGRLRAAAGDPQSIRELTCAWFAVSYPSHCCPPRSRRRRAARSAASRWPTSTSGADPCADFFEFANGRWRADNPIPASMPRWSRRWAAGEAAKDRLHEILEEASAVPNHIRGTVEQLIGDFYGACMDETQANTLGAKPIAPMLAEIDAVRNVAGVQRMIARFHAIGIPVPFSVTGGSDSHNPTDVIAQIQASGLGMPDRDYYVKSDARFKEAREKYVAHVENIFRLAGESDAQPRGRPARSCGSRRASPRRRSTTSRCAIRRRRITR